MSENYTIAPRPTVVEPGSEWIGTVPSHWSVMSIKRETRVRRGASPRPIEDPAYFCEQGEYAWVRIADVSASKDLLLETTQFLSELGKSKSVPLEPGSLFLSIAGSVGKPCIAGIKCCIHDGFVYFPDLKMDPRFLFYVFAAGEAYKGLGKLGTQLNLNTDTVGWIKVPNPPRLEQKTIIKFLDRKTALIDALIEKKRKLVELLAEKRAALINQAVTKGLDPTVPMKDSGIPWIGEIPTHWGVSSVSHYAEVFNGSTPSRSRPDYWDGDVPWLSSGKVNDWCVKEPTAFISRKAVRESSLRIARTGSVIIGMVGQGKTRGTSARLGIDATINQNMAAIVPNSSLSAAYLHYALVQGYRDIREYGRGGQQDALNCELVRAVRIALPPVDEQNRIAEHLDAELGRQGVLERRLDAQVTRLQEYRQALITAAVTGQLEVPLCETDG